MNPYGFPGFAMAPPSGAPSAPMEVPLTAVRFGEQSLWSTYQWADATALSSREYFVFSTPLDNQGQGFGSALSLAETNMQIAAQLPRGYAFDVVGIAFYPYYAGAAQMELPDLINMQNNCVLQWKFQQTRIEIAPVQLIGSGGGVFGSTADTGDVQGSRVALNNGSGTVWVYRLHPVQLPASIVFNIAYTFGASAAAVDGGAGDLALNARTTLLGKYQVTIDVG